MEVICHVVAVRSEFNEDADDQGKREHQSDGHDELVSPRAEEVLTVVELFFNRMDLLLHAFKCSYHQEYDDREDVSNVNGAFNENPEFKCLVLRSLVCKGIGEGVVCHDQDEVVNLTDDHEEI